MWNLFSFFSGITPKSTDVILSERNLTIFPQATASDLCGLTGRLNFLSNHLLQGIYSPLLLDLTYTSEDILDKIAIMKILAHKTQNLVMLW